MTVTYYGAVTAILDFSVVLILVKGLQKLMVY